MQVTVYGYLAEQMGKWVSREEETMQKNENAQEKMKHIIRGLELLQKEKQPIVISLLDRTDC